MSFLPRAARDPASLLFSSVFADKINETLQQREEGPLGHLNLLAINDL
jgi:hypothetical protein